MVKLGIILLGIILVAYSTYMRSLSIDEDAITIVGIILVIAGVVGFFFGGTAEEEIEQEDIDS